MRGQWSKPRGDEVGMTKCDLALGTDCDTKSDPLFSTILQATWMHILGLYPPGAGTLKYTEESHVMLHDSPKLHIGIKCVLYCVTPALDRYFSHSDRTPHTHKMTSSNICGTVLYNIWHPHSHPSLLLPSELTTHRSHHQLISTSSAIIHMSQDLSPIHSPYHCREKM